MVFWETEKEFCVVDYTAATPWIGFDVGFNDTEMTQMSIVACEEPRRHLVRGLLQLPAVLTHVRCGLLLHAVISTFFNVGVLLFHWTRPPQ